MIAESNICHPALSTRLSSFMRGRLHLIGNLLDDLIMIIRRIEMASTIVVIIIIITVIAGRRMIRSMTFISFPFTTSTISTRSTSDRSR